MLELALDPVRVDFVGNLEGARETSICALARAVLALALLLLVLALARDLQAVAGGGHIKVVGSEPRNVRSDDVLVVGLAHLEVGIPRALASLGPRRPEVAHDIAHHSLHLAERIARREIVAKWIPAPEIAHELEWVAE